MIIGQVMVAGALAYLALLEPGQSYVAHVLPGLLLFGLGLAIAVPPLTDTAMSSAPERAAGKASGVNNTAARLAGLVAIAALGLVFAASFRAELTVPHDASRQVIEAVERAERNPSSALEMSTPDSVRQSLERPMEAAAQEAYRNALVAGALMALLGALITFVAIRNPRDARPVGEVLRGIWTGKSDGEP